MKAIEEVRTANGPAPKAPYSQAVKAAGLVFVSGQGPIDPVTGAFQLGPIRDQVRLTLSNIKAIVEAAGSSMDRVVKCTVYLVDIADFAAMNEVYMTFFTGVRPARTTVEAMLGSGISVEIDAIAAG